ncbi:TPA: hypothetical protein ACHDVS_004169 [Escherichia coli]|nr:hypothetical protein [Escherichia coli]
MTTEENSLLIHHKIADFINNLRSGERFLLRIPLYSITDWHRSPISDSHPFDQPGT